MSEPIIEISGLGKTFVSGQNKVVALSNIDLTINKGEIFGIIGLSGAGKSTLVRCINFLEKPTSGKVIFDGFDLESQTQKQLLKLRQSMGMIFQGFNLLMQRNALQNVCFPLEISGVPKEKAKKRAAELLATVGLSEKVKAYPSQLSGGQKQRVAIARALATNPKVLLCDEATSALDPTTTHSILELLKKINKDFGITIVVITHEMRVIEEICSRVAIIDESRIVEQGGVSEIFVNPKSAIAKKLIFPEGKSNENFECKDTKMCLRIVFDGNSSFEPIIANMVLECGAPVNILFADTKNIDGKAFGQMLLQLPENTAVVNRMLSFLKLHNIYYEEEA